MTRTVSAEQAAGKREGGGELVIPEPPQIYVASLSDYNAGVLHGRWLAADQPPEALLAGVSEMLAQSPTSRRAEEWAIHDYTGFGAVELSEYEPVANVSRLAMGIARHGPAFAAWAALGGREPERLELFEEVFRGEWERLEDYAAELLDDLGATEALEQLPEWLQPYVRMDDDRFAQDLRLGGDVQVMSAPGAGVFVFDGTV